MREEYDFSKAKKNPYAKHFKQQITININVDVLEYFKQMSVETGIPYQTLINLYLLECKNTNKKLRFN